MLPSVSSVFVVYRCKTLTGSPDPTHAKVRRNLAMISEILKKTGMPILPISF